MKYKINQEDFDLEQTLDCGQCFRFVKKEDYFEGMAFSKILKIKRDGDFIELDCDEKDFEEIWKNYFDFDTNYAIIKRELENFSPIMKDAINFAPGIRILKQDPWEALCSFIISQNNNIPRIKGIISRLCENFGEKIGEFYSFPKPEKIASLTAQDLEPIKSGFRAKYILDAAKTATQTDLNQIYTMPIDEARAELMKIKGVGPKVAECVLLYGFHRTECFPLDVWMKRAMEVLFPQNKPEDFGLNAGIAQQYIFHYSRMNANLFD